METLKIIREIKFSAQGPNNEKNLPWKNFLYYGKLKFLIFPQKKPFLIFQETKNSKKFLVFQETELSHISGSTNPKKLLIFQETELSYILGEYSEAWKTKISYISLKKVINIFFRKHSRIIIFIFSINWIK